MNQKKYRLTRVSREDRTKTEGLTDAEREVLRVLGMIKGVAKA